MAAFFKCATSAVMSSKAGARNLVSSAAFVSPAAVAMAEDIDDITSTTTNRSPGSPLSCSAFRFSSSLATEVIDARNQCLHHHQKLQTISVILCASKRSQVTTHEGGGSSHSPLSRTEIRRMRVAELRDELCSRGLSSSGLRGDLAARLLDAASPSSANSSILDEISPGRSRGRATSNIANIGNRRMSAALLTDGDENEGEKKQRSSAVSCRLSPEKTYVLRFDGGSRGNPGIAGSGMVLYDADEGTEVWAGFYFMGENYTNNEAEYTGILEGLRCAHAMGARSIVVQGDSQLIIRQLEGRYRVKSEKLRPYYQQVVKLLRQFDSLCVCHIERAENARADELANQAMNMRQSSLDVKAISSKR